MKEESSRFKIDSESMIRNCSRDVLILLSSQGPRSRKEEMLLLTLLMVGKEKLGT